MVAVAPGAGQQEASRWPALLGLVLAVVACYANGLRTPFVFDDPFLSPELAEVELDYSTRPLVWASFDLNRALGGREVTGYHVFNLLVHCASAVVLLGLLRRTLTLAGGALAGATQARLALVITLLWACHPLQTESVTYVSQRAEALGALFTLAVLYAALRARVPQRSRAWTLAAWLALALGFLTKETIVTAPFLVWLYDLVFLARGPFETLRRSALLYLGLALITLACTAWLIFPLLSVTGGSAGFALHEFTALDYLRTQPGVLLHYLGLVFWPAHLCLDYAWPIARAWQSWVPQTVLVAAALLVTLWLLARRSWSGFAGAFFFVYLAPSSSFVPIRDPAVEHRMYLPLVVPITLAVLATHGLLRRWSTRPRWLAPALTAAVLAALGLRTAARNSDYRSPERLWRQATERAPHNARAHGNIGSILMNQGRDEEALVELMRAYELAPRDGPILFNLGKLHWRRGEHERARSFLRQGVANARDARGIGSLGSLLFEMGDFAGAVASFREALELTPRDAGAHYRLANALAQLGRSEEALRSFARALELAPGFQEARSNMAVFLAGLGRSQEALVEMERGLALEPNSALELHNYAQLLITLERPEDAIRALRQALQTEPENLEVQRAFAELALAQPSVPVELRREAFDALRAVIRATPSEPEPRAALAAAISQWEGAAPEERSEGLAEAVQALELAGERRPDLLAVLALAEAARGQPGRALEVLDEALAHPATASNAAFQAHLRSLRSALGASQPK